MPQTTCHFAKPLAQSTRSEVLEWRFPKPHHQYVLTGKSRAAWHTAFLVPQLNLLLDAGLLVNNSRPKQIFLTHGHSDHTFCAPAFCKRDGPPDVYCPLEMKTVFDQFVMTKRLLNLGGEFRLNEDKDIAQDDENLSVGTKWLQSHQTHGLQAGDVVSLPLTKDITATAFACDHTVPCLGYVFSMNSHKLKPEYRSLSGPELKALRTSGVSITAPHAAPIFAFLGDTTAATLAAEPSWLRGGIPVVITECSFLHEEHRAQAVKTKHTLWSDLEKIVRKWPRTTFVLTHFSLRYSDEEVRRFFADMADPPPNIVVWADGWADGI
ncbi:beta-lactamase-like protein [Pseudomassariella vexata]|uniref:Beta-lactamase-like protein n=1 Tax=Pseudomassariella vexata TaxID=1141098 RepID=A0A1Y2EIP8_9PEZI|nr:beta-lactamase-like protein [Pseudomassariella vexata]ORY71307.1 beta-lactamase-like protein [Pseudomassariella vexata]